jgi:hypothetical protein
MCNSPVFDQQYRIGTLIEKSLAWLSLQTERGVYQSNEQGNATWNALTFTTHLTTVDITSEDQCTEISSGL